MGSTDADTRGYFTTSDVQDRAIAALELMFRYGGPINGTQVLGSLAFQAGVLSGDVAHGAVICLFLFPFLLVAVIVLLRALRRREI